MIYSFKCLTNTELESIILLQLNVECELICVFSRNYSVLMLKYKRNHTVEFGNLSTNIYGETLNVESRVSGTGCLSSGKTVIGTINSFLIYFHIS